MLHLGRESECHELSACLWGFAGEIPKCKTPVHWSPYCESILRARNSYVAPNFQGYAGNPNMHWPNLDQGSSNRCWALSVSVAGAFVMARMESLYSSRVRAVKSFTLHSERGRKEDRNWKAVKLRYGCARDSISEKHRPTRGEQAGWNRNYNVEYDCTSGGLKTQRGAWILTVLRTATAETSCFITQHEVKYRAYMHDANRVSFLYIANNAIPQILRQKWHEQAVGILWNRCISTIQKL